VGFLIKPFILHNSSTCFAALVKQQQQHRRILLLYELLQRWTIGLPSALRDHSHAAGQIVTGWLT